MISFRASFPLLIPILFLLRAPAHAQTETILKDFGYFPQGLYPCGTVIRDPAGDLYGTTVQGGATDNGVVFERTASGRYKVLYSFQGEPDGSQPNAGVTEDAVGNLYGTTTLGGAFNRGTIYKLTPAGQETVLYSFTGGSDGANIYGGVAVDAAGNLYGTAEAGGSLNYGVVWEFSAAGAFTVLHNFAGFPTDGASPDAGVILDAKGTLYGTTSMGGTTVDLGTVFKLSPRGRITLLHSFSDFPQSYPQSGLTMDDAGNLYGAVLGAAFEISAGGQYTEFDLPRAGRANVAGGVTLDGAGNLYMVTSGEGGGEYPLYGAVFKVKVSSGKASMLYQFPGPPDEGALPELGGCPVSYGPSPGVVVDASGNISGSSQNFGLAGGIFEIDAAGEESALYQFPPSPGGSLPDQIIRDRSGVIFGITRLGGALNGGALYKLEAGVERTLPLPVAVASQQLGQDAEGNLYICGGLIGQGADDVYKITQSGNATLLYAFTDGSNCLGVTADAGGNVYGTTSDGPAPEGRVFRVSNTGEFTSLYVFSGGSDGGIPNPELTLDKKGNVYGTTFYGGADGGGALFRISPDGTETVLHDFIPETGAQPATGVTLGAAGDIYGAATHNGPNLQGTIYKLSAAGKFTVLYAFTGKEDGGGPATDVTLDATGNLYGTTPYGGDLSCSPDIGGIPIGCGVVFEFSASGSYSVVHAFTGGAEDGAQPSSAPVVDGQGNVYGATTYGGSPNYGVIYELTPILGAGPS